MSLESLLKKCGFQDANKAEKSSFYVLKKATLKKHEKKLVNIENLVIKQDKGSWHIHSFAFNICLEKLKDALLEQDIFQNFQSKKAQWTNSSNGRFLTIELEEKEDKKLLSTQKNFENPSSPAIVAGAFIAFQTYYGHFSVQISSLFSVGKTFDHFFPLFFKTFEKALKCDPQLELSSFFELCFDPKMILLAALIDDKKDLLKLKKSYSTDTKSILSLSINDNNLEFKAEANKPEDIVVYQKAKDIEDSRTLKNELASIDAAFIKGSYKEAYENTINHPLNNEPAVLKRAVLLADKKSRLEIAKSGLLSDPDYLNYHSIIALDHENKKECLKSLSTITANLKEKMQSFSDQKGVQTAIFEHLGDLWVSVDEDKAIACYQNALKEKKDIERIYLKLAFLAEERKDFNGHKNYLSALSKVSKDKWIEKRCYRDLCLTKADIDGNEFLEYAINAQRCLPLDSRFIDFLASKLLSYKKYKDAISLLEKAIAALKEDKSSESNRLQHFYYNIKIAKIWWQHLEDRNQTRNTLLEIKNALKDGSDMSIDLNGDYFQKAAKENDLQTQTMIYKLNLLNGSEKEALTCLNLIESHKKIDTKTLTFLYEDYLEACVPDTSFIEKMTHEKRFDLKWRVIYDRIIKKIDKITQKEDFLTKLSEFVLIKLKDKKLCLNHIRQLQKIIPLKPENLNSLFTLLRNEKEIEEIIAIIKEHINLDRGSIPEPLFDRILASKDTISEESKDFFIVHLALKNPQRSIDIEERFLTYADKKEYAKIRNLLTKIDKTGHGEDILPSLILKACEILENAPTKQTKELAKIYEFWQKDSFHNQNVDQRALDNFIASGDDSEALIYLEKFLDKKKVPKIKMKRALELLKDKPGLKSSFLELLYAKEKYGEKAVDVTREYWLDIKDNGIDTAKERSLASELSMKSKLSADELDRCYEIARKEEKEDWLIELLNKQRAKASSIEDEIKVVTQLKKLHKTIDDKEKDALEDFDFLIENSAEPFELIIDFLGYLISRKESDTIKAHFIKILDREDIWQRPDRIKPYLKWAYEKASFDTKEYVLAKTIKKALKHIKEDPNVLEMYRNVLESIEALNLDFLQKSLSIHTEKGDKNSIKQTLIDAFRNLKTQSDLNEFLEYAKNLFEGVSTLKLLKESLQQVLSGTSEESLKETFSFLSEIEVFYALLLFEQNENTPYVDKTLKSRFADFPDDYRTWIPLYFIFKERYPASLREFLAFVIPMLTQNTPLLRDFPVTLESLKRELADLNMNEDKEASDTKVNFEKLTFGLMVDNNKKALKEEAAIAQEDTQKEMIFDAPKRAIGSDIVRLSGHLELSSLRKSGLEVSSVRQGGYFLGQPAAVRGIIREYQSYEPKRSSVGLFIVKQDGVKPFYGGEDSDGQLFFDMEASNATANWRQTIESGTYAKDMTRQIINKAFEKRLEKHIALQSFALVSGETELLSPWHMKPWRQPNHSHYEYTIGDRMQHIEIDQLLNSHLQKLLMLLRPVMIETYRHKFSLVNIARRLSVKPKDLIDVRMPIRWQDHFFQEVGLSKYAPSFNHIGYNIFSIKGLKSDIYYDYFHKAVYFDGIYYKSMPVSFVFHRILSVIRSARYGFYPILKLHPKRHLLPIINESKALIQMGAKERLTLEILNFGYLGTPKNPKTAFQKAVRRLDTARLESLFTNIGFISVNQIKEHQKNLWQFLFKLQLAETLDLVGLSESVTNRDLLKNPPRPMEIRSLSPFINPLLKLAVELNFEGNENVAQESSGLTKKAHEHKL